MSIFSGRHYRHIPGVVAMTLAAITISYAYLTKPAEAYLPEMQLGMSGISSSQDALLPSIASTPPNLEPSPTAESTATAKAKPKANSASQTRTPDVPKPKATATQTDSSSNSSSTATSISRSNPLTGKTLFVDVQSSPPNGLAGAELDVWNTLGSISQALWLGDWLPDVSSTVRSYASRAQARGATGTIVLYNIPQRDCGNYSAGGVHSADAYRSWVSAIASAIRGSSMIALIEPDSLSLIDCLSESDKATRFSLLSEAVQLLRSAGATVYLDAGHSGWISVSEMASRLRQAGVSSAQGFSLNISNFQTNSTEINYGTALSEQLNGAHFVIDTSRNGNGPSGGEWCNPPGRKVGKSPTTSTGNSLVDAFLWVKHPGESDGTCNGGPPAGTWWSSYAVTLL